MHHAGVVCGWLKYFDAAFAMQEACLLLCLLLLFGRHSLIMSHQE
jgi:hypothetical protein